jgi:hypothetical protein
VNIADSFKPETLTGKRDKFAWEKDAYTSIPNFQGTRRKKKRILSDMGGSFYSPEKNIIKNI